MIDACIRVHEWQIAQGLTQWQAQSGPQSGHEIEIGLVEQGGITWLFGGQCHRVEEGSLFAYWAIHPHPVLAIEPKTRVQCLRVPLSSFIGWITAGSLAKALLGGQFLNRAGGREIFAASEELRAWGQELQAEDFDRRRAALLEIEARFCRLASRLGGEAGSGGPLKAALRQKQLGQMVKIAEYISQNFKDPISIPDIAQVVGLHPAFASRLFKRFFGVNLVRYLGQQRIHHARQLLLRSGLKVSEIAKTSGYRSVSHFYASHKSLYGMSPLEYRSSESGPKRRQEEAGAP